MRKEWSGKWAVSKQPRKQRKYAANAPINVKRKFLGANLSEELRKKHGRRTVTVRKGDEVKVMRGDFSGQTGKIERVSTKKSVLFMENVKRKKQAGTEVFVPMRPSHVQIIKLNLDDPKRIASIEKKDREGKKA